MRGKKSTRRKMSTIVVLIFAMGGIFSQNVLAQFREEPPTKLPASAKIRISEDDFFRYERPSPSLEIPGLENEPKAIQVSHKSPFLAAVLSFALPGLGEYYVGDHIWRGVIFTLLDAGLWYERYHFLGRGDDSTTAFENFSDANWSPALYASRLDSLLTQFHPGHQPLDPNNISAINKAEDSLNSLGLQNFTHQLPPKGTQQYYEIISKYIQYRLGWTDYVSTGQEFSPDYERAANLRANMNYQYQVADYFLYGLFLNRILSAIDAVLLARDHNTPVHLEGELQKRQFPDGTFGFIPTAKLQCRF